MTRRISSSRPITGSSLPWRASSVRSRPYFSRAWKVLLGGRRGHPVAAPHLAQRRRAAGPGRPRARRRGPAAGARPTGTRRPCPGAAVGRLEPVAGARARVGSAPPTARGSASQLLAEPARHARRARPRPGPRGGRRCSPAGPGGRPAGGPGSPRRGGRPRPARVAAEKASWVLTVQRSGSMGTVGLPPRRAVGSGRRVGHGELATGHEVAAVLAMGALDRLLGLGPDPFELHPQPATSASRSSTRRTPRG